MIRQLFVLFCLMLSRAAALCPPSSVTVSDSRDPSHKYCIHAYNGTANFCEAVRICHRNGQELISRHVYESMRLQVSDFLVDPGWWVGLTDAGNERNSNKDGWVWILDGHVTMLTDNGFSSFEPNNVGGNQDCVVSMTTSSGGGGSGIIELRDATCSELNSVFCYANSDSSVSSSSAWRFWQASVSAATQSAGQFVKSNANVTAFYKNLSAALEPIAACWQEAAATSAGLAGAAIAVSRLMCSHRCQKFYLDCLGFYWNPARQECVLIGGNDTIVLLPHSSIVELMAWQKFLRISWE